MTLANWFWVLMVIGLVFHAWAVLPTPEARAAGLWWRPFGGSLLLFILLAILGVHAFGWPIKG